MSRFAKRMAYTAARDVATTLLGRLKPGCERVLAAGSIRRLEPDVGDIEIVAIPRRGEPRLTESGLDDSELSPLLTGLVAEEFWKPVKGGDRYKQFELGRGCGRGAVGFKVDLFLAEPDNWGWILLLRTGPAEFSKAMVTQRSLGGYLPDHVVCRDGRLQNDKGTIAVPDEDDVFRLFGMRPIAPHARSH